jgi:hypothetical protein
MKRAALHLAAAVFALGACSDGFPVRRSYPHLEVQLVDGDDEAVVGARTRPLSLVVDEPRPFKIVVRALDKDGNVDAGYSGFVRISAKPGAIEPIISPDADGRSLKLTNGKSSEVEVRLTNAYGTTYILADDLGYNPIDPLGTPAPECADGIDNDGDGVIDFPADDGCAFANDSTEGGGSYAQGASPPIFYRLPRVADLRGLTCLDPKDPKSCSGTGKTPYPKQPLQVDTGYNEDRQEFDFDLVVTRISSDGFYVSDTKDSRGQFNSVFVFNFSAPPRMRICDRLKTFAGTADEFFGLTQMGYPTWTLEEWNPRERPCLVPEPMILEPTMICTKSTNPSERCGPPDLLKYTGNLVRVITTSDQFSVKVTPKFGPENVPEQGGTFVPGPNATNCDLNKDGKIDFDKLPDGSANPEGRCSTACTNDPECTEYSNFDSRSAFRLTVEDKSGNKAAIQADATTSTEFKPLERKGQPVRSFSGTLHFFSGGAQYTIEARCKDDIIVDMNAQPVPSDTACVHERTDLDSDPQ